MAVQRAAQAARKRAEAAPAQRPGFAIEGEFRRGRKSNTLLARIDFPVKGRPSAELAKDMLSVYGLIRANQDLQQGAGDGHTYVLRTVPGEKGLVRFLAHGGYTISLHMERQFLQIEAAGLATKGEYNRARAILSMVMSEAERWYPAKSAARR